MRQALEATELARQTLEMLGQPTDRLLVSRRSVHSRHGMFCLGLPDWAATDRWTRATGLTDADGQPLAVTILARVAAADRRVMDVEPGGEDGCAPAAPRQAVLWTLGTLDAMYFIANVSPRSTGKTTNTTWMCHALHERGRKVIGYDADASQQFSRWQATSSYPFPVQQAATEAFHVNIPQLLPAGYEDGVGVVDVGHLEDHKGIGWSVLRLADLAVINIPPTMNDVERMEELPTQEYIQQVAPLRVDSKPPATWVLLCKAPSNVSEIKQVRDYLTDGGYNVFTTVVPAVVKYMRTHEGAEVQAKGSVFDDLMTEMEERGLLP